MIDGRRWRVELGGRNWKVELDDGK